MEDQDETKDETKLEDIPDVTLEDLLALPLGEFKAVGESLESPGIPFVRVPGGWLVAAQGSITVPVFVPEPNALMKVLQSIDSSLSSLANSGVNTQSGI